MSTGRDGPPGCGRKNLPRCYTAFPVARACGTSNLQAERRCHRSDGPLTAEHPAAIFKIFPTSGCRFPLTARKRDDQEAASCGLGILPRRPGTSNRHSVPSTSTIASLVASAAVGESSFLPGQQGEACDDPRDRGLVGVEDAGPCFLDEVLSHIASRDDACFRENAARFLYLNGFYTTHGSRRITLRPSLIWSPFYIGRRDVLVI